MAYETEAQRIEEFVRRLGWPVARTVIAGQLREPTAGRHALLGALRSFATGYGRFTFTARDNIYLYQAPELQPKEHMLDAAEAEPIAQRFAALVVDDFEQRFARQAPQHVPPSFNFSWLQIPVAPETSVYPNGIDVRVDRRYGAVTRFARSDLPFVRTTPPRIDEASARARILELAGGLGIVDELSMSEDPRDGATRSETIWYGVVMREGGPYGLERKEVIIHADSGERYAFEGDPPASAP